VVGYRNYADDVVENFVQRACDNGMDIFRCFDALNDYRNFETAAKVVKQNKKHFQGTICYTLTEPRMGGETYNIDYYINKAKELIDFGVDSICIKDMAGLIAPYDIYNLIVELKKITALPINLHTHFTSGMGDLAILKPLKPGWILLTPVWHLMLTALHIRPWSHWLSHCWEPTVTPDLISKSCRKSMPLWKPLFQNTSIWPTIRSIQLLIPM
ncbi:MAG: hypothetical protein PHX54_09050, partial [Lentimicrobiaceae bacterium]|nr:hypothetical protein [Lentimicrobiaceae bacterium]